MALKHPTEFQKGKTMVYFVRHDDMASKQDKMPKNPDLDS